MFYKFSLNSAPSSASSSESFLAERAHPSRELTLAESWESVCLVDGQKRIQAGEL